MSHQASTLLRAAERAEQAEQERLARVMDADYTPILDKPGPRERAREYTRRVRRERAAERARGMRQTKRLLFCSVVIFAAAVTIALLWG